MKIIGKQFYLLLAICFWLGIVNGVQAQKIWSQVKLDRKTTYVGQPVEVSITVYTSTWFTTGIDPGNIKVNGAFTVYFRPVSTSFSKDGQLYSGVQLIYHVFPFDEKDIVFPSLNLVVDSPAEGDYKGIKHTLKTKPQNIKVHPIPPGFDPSQWLVATSLSVSENWQGNLKKVKVGDVLERKISRVAYGTVSELIPPIAWDSIAGLSMYPTRSEVTNHQSKTAISATRKESMRYLFEKEGKVTLPELVFNWYNPYQKQLYKRTLKAITIEVLPNPDLGVLESIKDSLNTQQAQEKALAEQENKPFTILGFSPKVFAALVLSGLLVLFVLIKLLQFTIRRYKKRKAAYLQSEAYFFDQFKRAARHKDPLAKANALYRWIDELNLEEPSLRYFIANYGTAELLQPKKQYDISLWKAARKKYNIHLSKPQATTNLQWINP